MFKSFSFQIYDKVYPTCSRLLVLMPRQAATSCLTIDYNYTGMLAIHRYLHLSIW